MRRAITIMIFLLSGCVTFGQRETTVQLPDGKRYSVRSLSDAILTYEDKEIKLIVDNRGRPSIVEQMFGVTASTVSGVAKSITPTAAIK